MKLHDALITLVPLAFLALAACSSDVRNPPIEGTPKICGVEVTPFSRGEIETSARECFLDAQRAGEQAQLFIVGTQASDSQIFGTVWTTDGGLVWGLKVSQAQRESPSQVEWSCMALVPTDDEFAFRATGCTEPAAMSAPVGTAPPERGSVLTCGAEVTVHSVDHYNRYARRCFQQAVEAGNPARLFSDLTTIEGDPIVEIYTVAADGVVDVFVDSRDNWGASGLFTYRCSTLTPDDPPLLWRLDSCTEREEF